MHRPTLIKCSPPQCYNRSTPPGCSRADRWLIQRDYHFKYVSLSLSNFFYFFPEQHSRTPQCSDCTSVTPAWPASPSARSLTWSSAVVQFAGPSSPDADQSKRFSTGVADYSQTGVVTSHVGTRRRHHLAAADHCTPTRLNIPSWSELSRCKLSPTSPSPTTPALKTLLG